MDNVTYDETESKTTSLAANTLKMPSWLLEMTDDIERIGISNDAESLQMETFLIDDQHGFKNITVETEDDTDKQPSASLSDLYIDADIKLQTSASKSLPNTPKNEQVQVKRRKTRACSAVLNTKHRTKNDFHGFDACLERKQMEKRDTLQSLASSNKNYLDEEEFYFEHQIPNVSNRADTRLHLSDDNCSNSSAFSTQNEEKSTLPSGRYREAFSNLVPITLCMRKRFC